MWDKRCDDQRRRKQECKQERKKRRRKQKMDRKYETLLFPSVCNVSIVARRRYKLLNSLTPLSASTSRFAVSRAEHGCCIHNPAAP